MTNCIDEKILEDGCALLLNTWISDVIQPGRQMFQLALVQGSLKDARLTIQFPIKTEHFSENQIREMYDSIRTKDDFSRLRQEYKEYA